MWLLDSPATPSYVASIAALAIEPTSKLSSGALAYVTTLKAHFELDTASTATPDSITVIAAANGGRWLRITSIAHPSWLAQVAWYIDPVSGSDEASGATSLAPIKTWAEYARRTGVGATIDHPVDVYLLNNLPESDPLFLRNLGIKPSGYLYIHGALTEVSGGSGTFTAVTARNAATNTPLQVTDGAGRTWVAGHLLKIVSGAAGNISAFAWVNKDLTGNAARITTMAKTDANLLSVTEVTPVAGDGYKLYTCTIVDLINIDVVQAPEIALGLYGNLIFENISISDTATNRSSTIISNSSLSVKLIGCRLHSRISTVQGAIDFLNCYRFSTSNFTVYANGVFGTRFIAGGTQSRILISYEGEASFDKGFLSGLSVATYAFSSLYGGALNFIDCGAIDYGGPATLAAVYVQTGGEVRLGTSTSPGKFWGSSSVANSYPIKLASGDMTAPDATRLTITGQAAYQFDICGNTTTPPFDRTASPPQYLAAISNTWANLQATVAGGGFGGSAIDPQTGIGIRKEA